MTHEASENLSSSHVTGESLNEPNSVNENTPAGETSDQHNKLSLFLGGASNGLISSTFLSILIASEKVSLYIILAIAIVVWIISFKITPRTFNKHSLITALIGAPVSFVMLVIYLATFVPLPPGM